MPEAWPPRQSANLIVVAGSGGLGQFGGVMSGVEIHVASEIKPWSLVWLRAMIEDPRLAAF